jgi:hypothetical protein
MLPTVSFVEKGLQRLLQDSIMVLENVQKPRAAENHPP